MSFLRSTVSVLFIIQWLGQYNLYCTEKRVGGENVVNVYIFDNLIEVYVKSLLKLTFLKISIWCSMCMTNFLIVHVTCWLSF